MATPTKIANPFHNIDCASGVAQQRLMSDGPAMMIACGLATRGFDLMATINLLPWREEQRQQKTKEFGVSALLTAVIAQPWSSVVFAMRNSASTTRKVANSYLQTEINKLKAELKEIEELESTKANLLARMTSFKSCRPSDHRLYTLSGTRRASSGRRLSSVNEAGAGSVDV